MDEFVEATGYNGCCAAYLLRSHRTRVSVGKVTIIGDAGRRLKRQSRKSFDRKSSMLETGPDAYGLHLWQAASGILKELIPMLEPHGEIVLLSETRGKLRKISAAR